MTDCQIFDAGNVVLQSGLTYRNARIAYSYCVIELAWPEWFCAERCSTDIAPGWLRERRSGVGGSSRSSLRHAVRGGRAVPRGARFWGTADAANLSAASPAAEGESLARSAIRKA